MFRGNSVPTKVKTKRGYNDVESNNNNNKKKQHRHISKCYPFLLALVINQGVKSKSFCKYWVLAKTINFNLKTPTKSFGKVQFPSLNLRRPATDIKARQTQLTKA